MEILRHMFDRIDQEIETERQGDFGDARDSFLNIYNLEQETKKPKRSLRIVLVSVLEDIHAVLSGEDEHAGMH